VSDWLDWEKRLKELAEDTAEDSWPDPNLQRLEERIIGAVSKSALGWMTAVWMIIKEVMNNPSQEAFENILDATDDDPIDIDQTVTRIVHSIDIAKRTVEHQDKLMDKGPWIEVPEPPRQKPGQPSKRAVKQKEPTKMMEWMARQSAGSKMREWAEGMREDVRWHVVQAIREGWDIEQLADTLSGRWDNYGQHFQTIAVTEMSMAYNNAMLVHLAGQHVVVPVIGDDKVCNECKHLLEGKVFYVNPTPIENPTKQEANQYMWAGKSNVGRKKVDWWACTPLHPRCRHILVRYRGGNPYDYKAEPRIR